MTSATRRRTFDRETLDASRAAWDAGEFGPEWREWRHLAAMEAGIVFPPDGSRWDSWGDDSPSQRAMLIRMVREQPEALRTAILRTRKPTWSAVIEDVLGVRDRMRDDLERDERDDQRRRDAEPTPRQATYALREILGIVGQS